MSQGIIDLYRRHAADWDRERGRSLIERPWLDRFLARLPLSPSVLDLGCGMAEPLAAYLIQRNCAITGLDSAPPLIELCRRRFPDCVWVEGDMRAPPVHGPFQGILAWNSFFHLNHDDQRRMFTIFDRLAASKAALMFTSGPAHGEAIGSMWGERLYHASLAPEEYRDLLGRHGFQVLAHRAEDPDCGGHTVWLAGRNLIPATTGSGRR